MCSRLRCRLWTAGRAAARALRRRLAAATRPAAAPLVTGALAGLVRTKPELVAENALLRQQLIILRRQTKRPRCTPADRALLVLLASRLRTWRHALLLVQPCSDAAGEFHMVGFRCRSPRVRTARRAAPTARADATGAHSRIRQQYL